MPAAKYITKEELLTYLPNTNGYKSSILILNKDTYKYGDKFTIRCELHGDTNRMVRDFIELKQCCGKCIYKTNNQHLVKIYTKEYLSSLFENVSVLEDGRCKDKIKCTCKIHGNFETTVITLIKSKTGNCRPCGYILANSKKFLDKTSAYYIEKCIEKFGDKFEYPNNLKDITSCRSLITVKCKKHNELFIYGLNNFLRPGTNPGCKQCFYESSINNLPKCNTSNAENELVDFIKSIYSDEILTSNRTLLGNGQELDIVLPKLKIAFEFNGVYWHSSNRKPNNYHKIKTELAESIGYKLIHIYEDEWYNNKEIIKSRIFNMLGKNSVKIYARSCIIKEVSPKESSEFLNTNHLQGNVNGKIKLGLYFNDELISIMTFGKLRKALGVKNTNGSFELLRFASKLNTTVIGGANKLFKHFIKYYNPNYILSFADRSWSNSVNNIYTTLNMKQLKPTEPGYYYYEISTKITKHHRFNFRKDKLIKLGYDSKLTEFEITDQMGLLRVYNSGNLKFEWHK
jgi:hypothetical protein